MAIDIRAVVTCSLGPLISASLNDDYIQQTGLIKTRGSCEIKGIITPAPGTAVTFQYTKGGITRRVPKVLRVLSCFADPFRRTTKVELGCKLTYLQDLVDRIDWKAMDDPENAGMTEDDSKIVTLPIRASSVMNKCLSELGITASSNPLTNQFSIGKFDFSSGYVNILSDLLVSESHCGYLDQNEVLQVFQLDADGGSGPLLSDSKIIDIGPIGMGQLPGDSVIVRYSSLKLLEPEQTTDPGSPAPDQDPESDEARVRRWELSRTISGPNLYSISYRIGNEDRVATYTGAEITETTTDYQTIAGVDVPLQRVTKLIGSSAKIAGSLGAQYLKNGIGFNASTVELERKVENFSYNAQGLLLETEAITYRQSLELFGSLPLTYVQSASDFVVFSYSLVPFAKAVATEETVGAAKQVTQISYKLWPLSLAGQQSVAESGLDLSTTSGVSDYINLLGSSGFGYEGASVSIDAASPVPVGRPANVISASYAQDGADPTNDWRTEQEANIELVTGSPSAQRRIEFSMPYAPDDRFIKIEDNFTSFPSNASVKATRYGRVQNRILLGNRSGMNIQTSPELVPVAPYQTFFISAAGTVGLYRINGTAWTMDSNGIVVSIDALYWGTAGQTA